MCNTKPTCQTGLKLTEAKNEILNLRQRLQELQEKQIKIGDLLLEYLAQKKAPETALNEILTLLKS